MAFEQIISIWYLRTWKEAENINERRREYFEVENENSWGDRKLEIIEEQI